MPYQRWFISDESFPQVKVIPLNADPPDLSDAPPMLRAAAFLIDPEIPDMDALQRLFEGREQFLIRQVVDHPSSLGLVTADGSIHWGKVVVARVPLVAILEWAQNYRDENRAAGRHPDRPPDVDTDTQHGWVMHPGEGWMNLPQTLVDDGPVVPILTYVHRARSGRVDSPALGRLLLPADDPVTVKVMVTWQGRYTLRVLMVAQSGRVTMDTTALLPEDPDEANAKIEKVLALLAEVADWSVDHLLTTAADFEEFERQAWLAEAELRDFYRLPSGWQAEDIERDRARRARLN